ncbi:MAG: hypothetical protein K2O24_00310 [Muribaculaceae bacterium]|nr:hypothetical protein [Muribaculaceae bacterium]
MAQDTERDTRHGFLNIVLFAYIGLGSAVTFLLNLGQIQDSPGIPFWVASLVFVSGAIFPLLAYFAIRTAFDHRDDTLYTIYLYLAYNAIVALLNLQWEPVLVDIACVLYFNMSSLVEELWPEEYKEWSKRLTRLTGTACIGVLMQTILFFT